MEEHSGPGEVGEPDRDTPAEDAQRHTSPYLDALFTSRAEPPNGIALEDIVALRMPHSCLICLTGGTCEVKLTEERLEAAKRTADLAQEKLDRANKRAIALTAAISILNRREAAGAAENRRTLAVDAENMDALLRIAGEDSTACLAALTTDNGQGNGGRPRMEESPQSDTLPLAREALNLLKAGRYTRLTDIAEYLGMATTDEDILGENPVEHRKAIRTAAKRLERGIKRLEELDET